MMRKKGILLNNTLAVIIVVIALVVVGGGIFRFYQITVNQEKDNAKKSLDNLVTRIENLKEGESGVFTLQGFKGADNWYFVGFSAGDFPDIPGKCGIESCLCVCKGKLNGVDQFGSSENYEARLVDPEGVWEPTFGLNSCNDESFCKLFDGKKIDVLGWDSYGENLKVGKFIRIAQNLMEINVKLTDSSISLLREKPYEKNTIKLEYLQ